MNLRLSLLVEQIFTQANLKILKISLSFHLLAEIILKNILSGYLMIKAIGS
ncbi:MAG: hypothetical protein KIIPBIDF_01900 [Candidatus Methanoperedenaceae archaeon GB50]|nr:MAG: hypothetical protein KIIPBIDF_01900 [Candidatus Methanoperedenaceae archaeon GB50]